MRSKTLWAILIRKFSFFSKNWNQVKSILKTLKIYITQIRIENMQILVVINSMERESFSTHSKNKWEDISETLKFLRLKVDLWESKSSIQCQLLSYFLSIRKEENEGNYLLSRNLQFNKLYKQDHSKQRQISK